MKTVIGEGSVDVSTPAAVRARVNALDAAWVRLNATAKLASTHAEYAGWQEWRAAVLESWLSQWFASGTLNTLDEWRRRYQAQYDKETAADPKLDAASPAAIAAPENTTGSGWAWYLVAATAGAALAVLAAGSIRR